MKPVSMPGNFGTLVLDKGDFLTVTESFSADLQFGNVLVPEKTWGTVQAQMAYTEIPHSQDVRDWESVLSVEFVFADGNKHLLVTAEMLTSCVRWSGKRAEPSMGRGQGVRVLRVLGDNHCLYGAVAAGTRLTVKQLRGAAVTQVLDFVFADNDSEIAERFGHQRQRHVFLMSHTEQIRGSNLQTYLLNQAPSTSSGVKVWGDLLMMWNLSQAIRTPIILLDGDMEGHGFDPDKCGSHVVVPAGWDNTTQPGMPVVLTYHDISTPEMGVTAGHFDRMLPMSPAAIRRFKQYVSTQMNQNKHWRPGQVTPKQLHRSNHLNLHKFSGEFYEKMEGMLAEQWVSAYDNADTTIAAMQKYKTYMDTTVVVSSHTPVCRIHVSMACKLIHYRVACYVMTSS